MNIGRMLPTTMPNITRMVSDELEKKRETYSIVYSSGIRTMFIRSRMALYANIPGTIGNSEGNAKHSAGQCMRIANGTASRPITKPAIVDAETWSSIIPVLCIRK